MRGPNGKEPLEGEDSPKNEPEADWMLKMGKARGRGAWMCGKDGRRSGKGKSTHTTLGSEKRNVAERGGQNRSRWTLPKETTKKKPRALTQYGGA